MKATNYNAGFVDSGSPYAEGITLHKFIAAVACHSCGHYATVEWKTKFAKADIPAKAREKIKLCPVCGAKLTLKKGRFVVTEKTSNAAAVNLLSEEVFKTEDLSYRESVSDFISKVPCPADVGAGNKAAESVISERSTLVQYLSHLIRVETGIHFLTERIIGLSHQKKEVFQKALTNKASDEKTNEKEKVAAVKQLKKQIAQIKQDFKDHNWETEIAGDLPPKPTPPAKPQYVPVAIPAPPTKPLLKEPGLFNKKKIAAENQAVTERYNQDYSAYETALAQAKNAEGYNAELKSSYEKDMAEYQKRMAQYQAALTDAVTAAKLNARNEADKAIEAIQQQIQAIEEGDPSATISGKNAPELFMEKEISDAKKQLRAAVKARNELYSYNIVHPKYRNYVAVSTFFDYVDTGRCLTLEGPAGAYNLYEQECRSNLIISQLSTIISTLEEIKQAQYLLYQEMKQVNENLKTLNKSMEEALFELSDIKKGMSGMASSLDELSSETAAIAVSSKETAANTRVIAKNSAITAHYSAVTAHYAKINAELTNALGFMVALK